jgi:hypothetical protein
MLMNVPMAAEVLDVSTVALYRRAKYELNGKKAVDITAEVEAIRERCREEGRRAGRDELAQEMKAEAGDDNELTSLKWQIARSGGRGNQLAALKAIESLEAAEQLDKAHQADSIELNWDVVATDEASAFFVEDNGKRILCNKCRENVKLAEIGSAGR